MQRVSLIIAFSLVAIAVVATSNSSPTNAGRAGEIRLARPTQTISSYREPSGINQAAQAVPTEGCITCHGQIEPMHKYGPTEVYETLKDGKDAVGLTCTACHGGNPTVRKTGNDPAESERAKKAAHVQARFPEEWRRDGKYTGANPERTNTLLARESWEFVRFVNPGDIRVATQTCGNSGCHAIEAKNVARSMMTHGAMLWGAALYNNGGFPLKDARFGESYNERGAPQRLLQVPQPSVEERRTKGLLS
ncbi:MAG TPA: hypothetical protein VFV61_00210, partial [Pyrinomonadaceae bacterium]|nr:hypothetical protein [Pyrinomonadaceae bacterium]